MANKRGNPNWGKPEVNNDVLPIAYSDDVNGGFQRDVNKRSGDVNKVGAQRRWNGNHA